MKMDLKSSWFVTEEKPESKEFKNIQDWFNSHDQGSKKWTRISTLGSVSSGVRTVTAASTLSDSDSILLVNSTGGAVTVTLPSSVGIIGRQYMVINTGNNIVTINTTGGQTINGGASTALPGAYFSVTLFSDGANWLAI